MSTDNYKHSDITAVIIKAFYNVYNTPGYGFLEKVYENALLVEPRKPGLECLAQCPIEVFYDDVKVGFYILALFAGNKSVSELLRNYLG